MIEADTSRFSSRSIRTRLIFVIVLTILATVILISSLSVRREFQHYTEVKQDELRAIASVLAATASEQVASADVQRSLIALRGIRNIPSVEYGRFETASGAVIAELGMSVILHSDLHQENNLTFFNLLRGRTLPVSVPVIHAGKTVGSLKLLVRPAAFRERVLEMLLNALLVSVAILAAALAAAWRLSNSITRPLEKLVSSMKSATRTRVFETVELDRLDRETEQLLEAYTVMGQEIADRDQQIATHIDTLEQKVAERTEQYRHAQQQAEQANQAKSDFLATMSHEIRTPMNGMIVMAEMLAKAGLQPKQQRFADIILGSGRTLLRIINDVLDLSKVEAGEISFEPARIEIGEIASNTIEIFKDKAASKSIDLTLDISDDLPVLEADPVRIQQVIANLTNNAIKFTESGGVSIQLRCSSQDRDHATIEATVTDTGIGIPDDRLDSIFERFTQAEASTTRQFGGTGLGLAIVKKLVEAMGGEISVRSSLGEGSVFSFVLCLPLWRGQEAQPTGQSVAAAEKPPRQLAGARVLVADDNPVNIEVAVEALNKFGIKPAVATDGSQAMLAATKSEFDLVLMDLSMPVMDGVTAAELIRQHEQQAGAPRAPIIALTAGVAGQADPRMAQVFDGRLSKPFTLDELGDCLQHWIGGSTADKIKPDAGATTARSSDDMPFEESATKDDAELLDDAVLANLQALDPDGSQGLLARLISMFRQAGDEQTSALISDLENGEYSQIAARAHALKSMSLNIGARSLAATCARLEARAADNQVLPMDVGEFADQLRKLFVNSTNQLEQRLHLINRKAG